MAKDRLRDGPQWSIHRDCEGQLCLQWGNQVGLQSYGPYQPLAITTVLASAREQVEERVRILDGIMNLGYHKTTNFALRVFLPSLGSNPQTNVMKSIEVIGRKRIQSPIEAVQGAVAC